jgi:putative glutamine amidotransferase
MNILITANTKKYFNTYIDFIDHYWLNYFEKKKINFKLIPNSDGLFKKSLKTKIDLIILPGGNDISQSYKSAKIRLNIERKLIKVSLKNKIPIIGICRGMQVINNFFGGKLKKVKGHMRTKHNLIFQKNFFLKKKFMVNSFHNYGITKKTISKQFEIFAYDLDENIEMFKHKKHNIYGVMWHPEREKNYLNLNQIINKVLKK